MSILTNFLKLFKYNVTEDGASTFNIDQALNDNWDKIDTAVSGLSAAQEGAAKAANLTAHTDNADIHFTPTERTKLAGIAEGATNYAHPATHQASIIVPSADRRFCSDTEKAAWNGKADAIHAHAASDIAAGTFGGIVTAVNPDTTVSAVRNIIASTTDLTAGTSPLTTGSIYVVYE